MRLRWLFGALVLSLALLGLHLFALKHFWYWQYPVFDILMHVLGGAALAAFGVALLRVQRPLVFLAAMAVVFVGWEVIEYAGGVTRVESNYVFDTAHDLLNDVLGAVGVYALARTTIWR